MHAAIADAVAASEARLADQIAQLSAEVNALRAQAAEKAVTETVRLKRVNQQRAADLALRLLN